MRIAWEYFVPRRSGDGDESLGSFVRRRLGREVFDRLVQPLVAGIYTADPERLSLAATLPRFIEMERKHGSLIRGALSERSSNAAGAAQASGARYSLFITPREGLSSLVAAVAASLPAGAVRVNTRVTRFERRDATWRIATATDSNEFEFDAVVLAIPASAAADLLAASAAPLSAELAAIPYASTAVVSLAYDRSQIAHPLDGFGFVVPAIEGRRILSASFSSQKFPGRAPADKVLLRIFIGGACQPEYLKRSDAELQQLAAEEIADLLGASGQPLFATIARWPQSMPQYHLGHLDRVAKIESRVAGDPRPGVGRKCLPWRGHPAGHSKR